MNELDAIVMLTVFSFLVNTVMLALLLTYRYLQESGFVHSSFTFVYESMLGRSNIKNAEKSIPPGALLSFLQKGLQYVAIEESLQRDGSKPRKSSSIDGLSLLTPQTITALTRENPPIQLNVPPATAAAAVKARLEAESKIEAERKAAAVKAVSEQAQLNGVSQITGPSSIPPQPLLDPNPLSLSARNALASHAVAAQAAATAMSHLQQQGALPVQVRQAATESAGAAAAIAAHERRAVAAEMAALKEQQQQLQLQQHLQQQQQQQLHHEQLQRQQQQHLLGQAEAATTLASVAGQIGNKRSGLSAKKGPKIKGKVSKQRSSQPETDGLDLMAQAAPGFASLEEAVARLEASNGVAGESSSRPIPMDVEENDQQNNGASQPAHVDMGAVSIPSQELINGQRTDHNGQGFVIGGHRPINGQQPKLGAPMHNGPLKAKGLMASGGDGRSGLADDAGSSKSSAIDREDEKTNASPAEVLELKMHSSEVFMCAWNPVFTDMIATGSGDASARIWQMGGAKAAEGLGPVRLLPHGTGPRDRKNKDVTTLEWSSDGKLLATGSYDGVARVWSRNGALVHTLRGHKGPIFSLKWNKRGNYLLSGSYDKTTIVWDVSGSTGFVEQQFNDHQAPALDVDWKDDTTFASCSTDKTVHICRVGMPRPLKTYTGHTDEVNAVKWDPSGTLLASCSDDCTAKVWDVGSDRKDPMQDFKSHQQEIYTVKW